MKKKLLVGLLFPILCSSQVGVNTATPQKTLHINGSLQITNELNVGGTSNAQGSSGTSGQVLTSQGPNLAPLWTTLNIPPNDINTYKLKKVYQVALNSANTSVNSTSLPLGSINNIEVNSADNFIYLTTQSNTYLSPFTDSSPSISYRFDFLMDGTVVEKTSWESIQRQGFSDVAKNNPYQFTLLNVSPGIHNFSVNGVRQNLNGTNRTLYFNTIDTLNTKPGSLVIFVYEK